MKRSIFRRIKCLLGFHKFDEVLLYPFKVGSVEDLDVFWMRKGGFRFTNYMMNQSLESYNGCEGHWVNICPYCKMGQTAGYEILVNTNHFKKYMGLVGVLE